jgi:fatty acid synthase subunit alpha
VLTTAQENAGAFPSPLLDINYRRRQIELRKKQIGNWRESELEYIHDEIEAMKAQAQGRPEEQRAAALEQAKQYADYRRAKVEDEAVRQEKEVLRSYGNNFWKSDPSIAPLRGALATWGLTIDDLDVASFHGTSTKANDKNESSVICQQLRHLGRKKGNAVLGIFQKYLTGHPKGAAGAWMMNGCLQVLNTGLVPGNRNADNVDPVMEQFDLIVYPSRAIQTDGIKAFSVTSFGFGQKGAQAIGVHPRYLFATLDEQTYNAYCAKVEARQKKAYRFFHTGLVNNTIFVPKDKAPYADDQLSKVLLNPDARVSEDKKTSQLVFANNFMEKSVRKIAPSSAVSDMEAMARKVAAKAGDKVKVGVDHEDISAINIENETFLDRNFTAGEIAYCRKAPSPQSSFAGRWSAKEAVFKSLGVASQGGGAALKDIEVLQSESGAPVVKVSSPTRPVGYESLLTLP